MKKRGTVNSNALAWSGCIKRELAKIVEPGPMKKSEAKYPKDILNIAKTPRGKAMTNGGSWTEV